jgi:hypothetical protein
MRFMFGTADRITIRQNPTTQISIRVAEWPDNTFLLWLPEDVTGLWNNWSPGIAHQDFVRTECGGLLWNFEHSSGVWVEAELIPECSRLLLEVSVTNSSGKAIPHLGVQNCFHLSAAPDFCCDDFGRIYIRVEGVWRSVASLNPTSDRPMYYRPHFLESDRTDSWRGMFSRFNEPLEADSPLIICVSRDGTRCVGTASGDYQCVFHNQGCAYLRCIHSQQAPVEGMAVGETVSFRQKVYFVEGGLMDCVAAFESDCLGSASMDG